MKESQTEELIINTAKHIIFFKGNFQATTQDIADAAGVNRALIHYYFRTREQLMEAVLKAGMVKMNERIVSITESNVSFRKKIEHFISIIIDEALETPYLENFVVHEFNRLDLTHVPYPNKDDIEIKFKYFINEIIYEMKIGTIPEIDPVHFIINLVALCVHPISTRPLIQRTFNLDDVAYQHFIQEQKQIVYKIIFRE